MNSKVKNILVGILLVVLSPVTFALCPCMAEAGKRKVCCCKKSQLPAEKKCPSKKQMLRLQSLEKQCTQQQHEQLPLPAFTPAHTTGATTGGDPVESMDSPAQKRMKNLNDPPALFLEHCCFRI